MNLFEIRQRLKELGIAQTDCKIACREFLPKLLHDHRIAITLTLKTSWYSMNGKQKVTFHLHDANIDAIWARFVHKLNKSIWKNAYRSKRDRLSTIAVLEDAHGTQRKHLHGALGHFPHDFDLRTLPKLVKRAAQECYEIDVQHREDICDRGWFEYITKHVDRRNTDNVIWG